MLRPTEFETIEKILVISLSNIGDVVLTTPVISLLRERFPARHLSVMVGPKAQSLFQDSTSINELIVFNKKDTLSNQIRLMWRLLKQRYDLVVDLRNTAIPFFIFPRYRTSFFVNHSAISMRQKHLDRIRFLLPVQDFINRFDFFSLSELKSAKQKLRERLPDLESKKIIILALGAGSELKRWTLSGFADAANHFVKQNAAVVLLGDQRETSLGDELERNTSKPIANLIGRLTLRESAALIHAASLVVANDSALMHLSHELNRPTVAIFGPTDDRKYGRTGVVYRTVRLDLECTPCQKAQCQIERRKCLDDLQSSQVINACNELLTHAPHQSVQN